MVQYIFGYGSLISQDARNKTAHSKRVLPARVCGYRRFWNAFPLYGWSPLAVRRESEASCNGVLIAVDAPQLELFDRREGGYAREIVEHDSIELLEDADLGSSFVWIYVPLRSVMPGNDTPILQSYVDVAVTGCLDYSERFAREFVETTDYWDSPWLDDRSKPTYVRSLDKVRRAREIDQLLGELVAEPYYRRFS